MSSDHWFWELNRKILMNIVGGLAFARYRFYWVFRVNKEMRVEWVTGGAISVMILLAGCLLLLVDVR